METKVCCSCKLKRSLKDFAFKNKDKQILQSICKECKKKYNKGWYKNNSTEHKASAKENKKRYAKQCAEFILAYLSQHPCVDCNEKDPVVLDFDHVRGAKSRNISEMNSGAYSVEAVQKEIEKCEVRCANCHRRKTAKEQNWHKRVSVAQLDRAASF